MKKCSFPSTNLVAYADGELDATQQRVVEVHLQDCAACRQLLAGFKEVDQLIQQHTPEIDDPARRANLRAQIADEPH